LVLAISLVRCMLQAHGPSICADAVSLWAAWLKTLTVDPQTINRHDVIFIYNETVLINTETLTIQNMHMSSIVSKLQLSHLQPIMQCSKTDT